MGSNKILVDKKFPIYRDPVWTRNSCRIIPLFAN